MKPKRPPLFFSIFSLLPYVYNHKSIIIIIYNTIDVYTSHVQSNLLRTLTAQCIIHIYTYAFNTDKTQNFLIISFNLPLYTTTISSFLFIFFYLHSARHLFLLCYNSLLPILFILKIICTQTKLKFRLATDLLLVNLQ